MASEYFRSFGWKIKFIGSSVPIDGLIKTITEERAEVMVISAITGEGLNSAGYLITTIKLSLGDKSPIIVLGGSFGDTNRVLEDTNADIVLGSLESLMDEIPKIEATIKKHRID